MKLDECCVQSVVYISLPLGKQWREILSGQRRKMAKQKMEPADWQGKGNEAEDKKRVWREENTYKWCRMQSDSKQKAANCGQLGAQVQVSRRGDVRVKAGQFPAQHASKIKNRRFSGAQTVLSRCFRRAKGREAWSTSQPFPENHRIPDWTVHAWTPCLTILLTVVLIRGKDPPFLCDSVQNPWWA